MKNPYPKGKGKVHPSPLTPGGGGGPGDVMTALRFLPAAIFLLTAALGEKDKEVLAYLIARSMRSHVGQEEEIVVASHAPTIGCGCFECYTSFWSRWDGSSDREIIHQAIEAFEEHLAKVEKEKKEPRKKKHRRAKEKAQEPSVVVLEERVVEELVVNKELEVSVSPQITPRNVLEEEEGEMGLVEEEGDKSAINGGTEKKKGWADVMGIFNFRLWGA
ncbi:hypothetical protein LUZ60_007950 [Juncus effusus]|nr:hypothetical protein LUZ60_007950 [Juncus effusus]